MAESSLPSTWPEALQSLHANSLWFFPLVATERLIEGHFYQAGSAMAVWLVAAIAAVQGGVLKKVTSTPERRQKLLTWAILVAGAALLAWGIARLATETRLTTVTIEPAVTTEPAPPSAELKAEREARAVLDRQLAATRRELQETQSQRDAAQAQAKQSAQTLPPKVPDQGPVDWDFDRQFVVTSGNEMNPQVHGVFLQGTSREATGFTEAYAISGLTGRRQDLMANANGYHPVSSVDVPAQAPVVLELVLAPGMPLRDFMEVWGKFGVTIKYVDGSVLKHEFDEKFVRQKVQRQFPSAFGPRVTPREKK